MEAGFLRVREIYLTSVQAARRLLEAGPLGSLRSLVEVLLGEQF